MKYEVILRRANGRYVRSEFRDSKYRAKQLAKKWEEKYDAMYYVEIKERDDGYL
jgi:hypothetical protein